MPGSGCGCGPVYGCEKRRKKPGKKMSLCMGTGACACACVREEREREGENVCILCVGV